MNRGAAPRTTSRCRWDGGPRGDPSRRSLRSLLRTSRQQSTRPGRTGREIRVRSVSVCRPVSRHDRRMNSRAGQPAEPRDLVDVAHLVTAYYTRTPDPERRRPAGRVRHQRPPRVVADDVASTRTHILATTQAICEYRREQGYDGPLFLGRDTHALSEPAWATALEVLVANGVTVLVDAARRATRRPPRSRHAILRANARPHDRRRPGRRHRRHAVAQPAARRRLQVQPAARRPGRHRRHRLDRASAPTS